MQAHAIRATHLYHVGTLDPERRGHQMSESQEGHLLSVSNCPHSWEAIARLGGNPFHVLTASDDIVMLDVLKTLNDPDMASEIEEWGRAAGLCTERELWRAWSTGEEGDWRFITCESEEEAREECDEMEEARPEGLPLVEPFKAIVGTPMLEAIVKLKNLARDGNSLEYVAIAWAEEKFPDLHGAWWDEDHDVAAYSAPRGGIYPAKMAELHFAPVDRAEAPREPYDLESILIRHGRRPTP